MERGWVGVVTLVGFFPGVGFGSTAMFAVSNHEETWRCATAWFSHACMHSLRKF